MIFRKVGNDSRVPAVCFEHARSQSETAERERDFPRG